MYRIILIIPFLSLLYNVDLSNRKSSIEGRYEWNCSFYENSTFSGMHFYETKGNLTVKSLPNKIEFLFVEGEKNYSFILSRDSIYNLDNNSKYGGEYNIVQSKTDKGSGMRLKSMINLLSYAFLLNESQIDNDNLRLVSREISYKANKRIAKFKEDKINDKMDFEIFNSFGNPKYINNVKGNFNIDPKEKNSLECIFETYFLTSAFITEIKGIIVMRKIK
jgi:hypothetical protein